MNPTPKPPALDKVRVAGYRSIRDQEVDLRALNVLIGANGAGKSNFISLFRLLRRLVDERLQAAVTVAGGASQLLHFGPKRTSEISLGFEFGLNSYQCRLEPTEKDSLYFAEETVSFHGPDHEKPYQKGLGSGHLESALGPTSQTSSRVTIADYVLAAFRAWQVYHFHDTTASSPIKQKGNVDDDRELLHDGRNLAAFLYRLQEAEPATLRRIVETVRLVAPFFDGFTLAPDRLNGRIIQLEWREKGSDLRFGPNVLSDGSLRFVALATLLLQPELPATIVIDEPELGLHPAAITMLAALLRSAATRTQVVVSTQSVTLLNQLAPEDVLVVDRIDGASTFRRLELGELEPWLEEYSLGELWEKNVVGGRP